MHTRYPPRSYAVIQQLLDGMYEVTVATVAAGIISSLFLFSASLRLLKCGVCREI